MTDRIYQDLMNGLKTNNNIKQWVKDNVNNIFEPIVFITLKNGMFITAIHSRFEKKLDFVENVTIHGRNLNEIRSANFEAMHHYMRLSVDDYSQSFEGNL